jgi:hypothetical protein
MALLFQKAFAFIRQFRRFLAETPEIFLGENAGRVIISLFPLFHQRPFMALRGVAGG